MPKIPKEDFLDPHIAGIIDRIHALEADLELEFAKRRLAVAYTVKSRLGGMEEQVLKRHRELKASLAGYILGARPLMLITAPVIYSLVVPFLLLDLFVSIYQHACFPVYGIARVRRADYMAVDRGHLAYLNLIEKLNCTYCSYANGLIAYTREVAARTEQHWCPIKHARRIVGSHDRYRQFADYGDAEAYRTELEQLRVQLAAERDETRPPT